MNEKPEPISDRQFATALYYATMAFSTAHGTSTARLYPVSKIVMAATGYTFAEFSTQLDRVFNRCIKGELPYGIALHPDRTFSESATLDKMIRAGSKNIITAGGFQPNLIEMKYKGAAK